MTQTLEQKKGFKLLEFNKGQVIFREGQSAKQAYLIRSGKVAIYKDVNDRKTFVTFMVPGQILGEMAIITGEPRSASAEAAEFCELLVMDKKTLQNALNDTLPIIKALLNQLIVRINETDKKNRPQSMPASKDKRRIEELERGLKAIIDEAADWQLAQPNMDPHSRQCLDIISNISQRTLRS